MQQARWLTGTRHLRPFIYLFIPFVIFLFQFAKYSDFSLAYLVAKTCPWWTIEEVETLRPKCLGDVFYVLLGILFVMSVVYFIGWFKTDGFRDKSVLTTLGTVNASLQRVLNLLEQRYPDQED